MRVTSTLSSLSLCLPSPLQKIEAEFLNEKSIALWVKRDDLIHPLLSGNKWRKLKYNLLRAEAKGINKILSFGGAYSNHIHALAAAGNLFGFETIGIIRGDEPRKLSHTLRFAQDQGMKLQFVSRSEYRQKHNEAFINKLHSQFGDVFIIPEGGSNSLALPGVAEIIDELGQQLKHKEFSVVTACGSGGTAAGLLSHPQAVDVKAIAALKGAEFLKADIENLLGFWPDNFSLELDYHFGGYAKFNQSLLDFVEDFNTQFDIPLEPIYTGKMMYALWDLIQKNHFSPGSCIVVLHTGGLQGYLK